ncbi:MAG: hypothetical protein GY868_21620, partial [Deltaproteobacteria bacterium]|nr:hypothetical protein [Deltaproteobacteria bacterium]
MKQTAYLILACLAIFMGAGYRTVCSKETIPPDRVQPVIQPLKRTFLHDRSAADNATDEAFDVLGHFQEMYKKQGKPRIAI